MGDRMTCPGCGAESSSVLMAVRDDGACPFCGLSAAAIGEVLSVQRRRADEDLKQQLSVALIKIDRLEQERRTMLSGLRAVRDCVQAVGEKVEDL